MGACVLAVPGRYCVSYLIVAGTNQKAGRIAVVDVGSQADHPLIFAALGWLHTRHPKTAFRITTVIASHLHFDHVMGIDSLARRLDADVALSRKGHEAVKQGQYEKPRSRNVHLPAAASGALRWPPLHPGWKAVLTWFMQGMPFFPLIDWREGMDFGFPWARNRFRAALASPLHDGDPLPGLDGWTVLETPGHADDGLCLYHRAARFLIAGDVVRNFLGGEWNPLQCCAADFARTRKRLCALDIETVFPGHGPVLQGPHVLETLAHPRPYLP
jgi:glyoxylase-like metal-dependent hydrolase (beta-lactamase superfamily II)